MAHIIKKVSSKDFYKIPSQFHSTGDIWSDLPSFKLLNSTHTSGLVITPACDLANNKVETITILPIVPIIDFLSSRLFYNDFRIALTTHFNNLNIPKFGEDIRKNYIPTIDMCKLYGDLLAEELKKDGKKPYQDQLIKGLLGIQILNSIVSVDPLKINSFSILKKFYGESNYKKLMIDIIRNSHSSELHFLPKDEVNVNFTPIQTHSLVLFRYPITVPIEILNLANDVNCSNWEKGISSLSDYIPSSSFYRERRPVKCLTLQVEFLGDLIARFLNLHLRLGSPDFTSETIMEIFNSFEL